MNLSLWAESSPHTENMKEKKTVCHVSYVTCHVSDVVYHLSLTQTATVTDSPPANFPTLHSMLVCKEPKIQNNLKN